MEIDYKKIQENVMNKVEEMNKNWKLASFTPVHCVPYLYMVELEKNIEGKL